MEGVCQGSITSPVVFTWAMERFNWKKWDAMTGLRFGMGHRDHCLCRLTWADHKHVGIFQCGRGRSGQACCLERLWTTMGEDERLAVRSAHVARNAELSALASRERAARRSVWASRGSHHAATHCRNNACRHLQSAVGPVFQSPQWVQSFSGVLQRWGLQRRWGPFCWRHRDTQQG